MFVLNGHGNRIDHFHVVHIMEYWRRPNKEKCLQTQQEVPKFMSDSYGETASTMSSIIGNYDINKQ